VRLTADGTLAVNPLARAGVLPLVSEAYGDVGVHVELAPGRTPLVRAKLELRELITHVGPELIVRKVNGTIAIEDTKAKLDGLRGQLGGGTLELGGQMELSGLSVTRYDLTLGAKKVALEPQPRFEITFDADARLESGKNGRPPKVSGTFKVARLLYGRHIQLPEALVAMNRSDRTARSGYAPGRDRLLVDIAIEHSAPLVVRNNFLDAELSLRGGERKLRVVGSDQRFGLLGELAVDRGRVLYRGDEFQITRGAVSFADPERVDPVFDLRAIAQKRARADASIVFSARGDRDAFQIDVRCDTKHGTAPEPFDCDFANDKLRCDGFDILVQQFACRPKTELSSAER
jgi:translocation and assembly module TamB